MTRAVLDFGGGRSGGRTMRAENAIRDTLKAGGKVLSCHHEGNFIMSLADDGFTLVRTPVPAAAPSAGRARRR